MATFAKVWDGTVTGGVLSDTPGGAPASLDSRDARICSWNAVPGAAYYQVQIAAGSQFASPVFDSGLITQTGVAPGASGRAARRQLRLARAGLRRRQQPRPLDGRVQLHQGLGVADADRPGRRCDRQQLRAAAGTRCPGASSYEVQVTKQEFNFTSGELVVNGPTASTAYVPDLAETQSHSHRAGPVLVAGASRGRRRPGHLEYRSRPSRSRPRQRHPRSRRCPRTPARRTTALTPVLGWTPVTGAAVYRIDIATDNQFNNIVFSDLTTNTEWSMRSPLPDNQVNGGYYWRVVWGAIADATNPGYMVDETSVPVATFTKQTQPTARHRGHRRRHARRRCLRGPTFRAQVSTSCRSAVTSSSRTRRPQSMSVYGLGTWWNPAQGSPLTSGTWYWRVRPEDDAGNSLTYNSPAQSFVINPPAPAPSAPGNGATVIASPKLSWAPVNGACSYDVQVSDSSTFPSAGAGAGSSIPDGANTAQTAFVPTGNLVTHAGTWYWRVRAELCNTDTGAWSNTAVVSAACCRRSST